MIKNADTDIIRQAALKNGMTTIRKACEKLVFEGKTTLDELIKIAFFKD